MSESRTHPANAPHQRRHPSEPGATSIRMQYAIYVAIAWIGVIAGFSPGIARHITGAVPPLPLFMHAHGVVMLTWLSFVTLQIALVARGPVQLHRRIGTLALPLGLAVVVATLRASIGMTRAEYPTDGNDVLGFFYNELNDTIIFIVLTGSAYAARRRPEAHRRLTLLSLLFVTAPGFARPLGRAVAHHIAEHPDAKLWAHLFIGPDLLMLTAILIDHRGRGRVHPVYLVAAPILLANQVVICQVVNSSFWPGLARRLLMLARGRAGVTSYRTAGHGS